MAGRLPNFLIVGAMKSGTTSLSAWLGAHPEAFVAADKELHFFNAGDHWARGLDWYREQFAAAGDAKAVGEATPGYMYFPHAVERMAATLPDAKLIAVLRNPVDRALSHYRHWYYRDVRERRTFRQAIEAELAAPPVEPRPVPGGHDSEPEYWGYLTHGLYAAQLENLLRHYRREQLHVVLAEDLKQRPQETFAGVCRYLGIDDTVAVPAVGRDENVSIEFRPLWLWRILVQRGLTQQPPPRWVAWLAPKMMRIGVQYEPVDPELRARIAEWCADDVRRLARLLDRDLTGWGIPGAVPMNDRQAR